MERAGCGNHRIDMHRLRIIPFGKRNDLRFVNNNGPILKDCPHGIVFKVTIVCRCQLILRSPGILDSQSRAQASTMSDWR